MNTDRGRSKLIELLREAARKAIRDQEHADNEIERNYLMGTQHAYQHAVEILERDAATIGDR